MGWDLSYTSTSPPLKLLHSNLYDTKLPKAKALVGSPLASFTGSISINTKQYSIENWIGSENHNWGSQHTNEYAWGQVAGFDNDPTAFLECATARIKIGPFKSPWMTTLVLRYDDKEIAINSILRAIKAKGKYQLYHWEFETTDNEIRIKGVIKAEKEDFATLLYYNPPSGHSTCLNSKIASCNIQLFKREKLIREFTTTNKAAFEILSPEVK